MYPSRDVTFIIIVMNFFKLYLKGSILCVCSLSSVKCGLNGCACILSNVGWHPNMYAYVYLCGQILHVVHASRRLHKLLSYVMVYSTPCLLCEFFLQLF